MASAHWKAFSGIPETFMRDLPAVVYYAGSSWLNSMLHQQAKAQLPGNAYIDYFVDGLTGTLNQDYLINLIGEQDKLPKSEGMMSPSTYTGYNY